MAEPAAPTLIISTAVNDNDHGARIVVIAVICLVGSGLFTLTRLAIRYPWKALFGADDVVCLVATAVSFIQTAVLLRAVEAGLGQKVRTLDLKSIVYVEKLVFTADLIYVFALGLNKLAVAMLFRRLSPSRGAIAMSIISIIYGIASVLTMAIRPPFSQPWNVAGQTTHTNWTLFARWAAVEGAGITVDVFLIVFPAYLLWPLRMKKDTKISIIFGFALRFPVIILAGFRIASMAKMDWLDASIMYVDPEIFGQLEMHLNTIAATVPCLRIFLRGWNTGFLGMSLREIDQGEYERHSGSKSRNATAQTISSGGSKTVRTNTSHRHREMVQDEFKSQSLGHTESTISSQRGHPRRSASIDSQYAIMIHQTVDVDSSKRLSAAM